MPLSISSTEASARAFFAKPYFAVVGASTNQAKFGYKSGWLSLSLMTTSRDTLRDKPRQDERKSKY